MTSPTNDTPAPRWTADDRAIFRDGQLVASGGKPWGKLSEDCCTAQRLAACADKLREFGELGELGECVVMTRADADRIREFLSEIVSATTSGAGRSTHGDEAAECLALLPTPSPAKG